MTDAAAANRAHRAERSIQPRRVLMTADPLGGVWNYCIELVRASPETPFALCTMGAPLWASQQSEIAPLPNAQLFASSFRLEWMDDPWRDVDAAGDWLLETAAQFRPDVIHLNGYSHAILPWNAPVLVVAHSCVLSWWRAVKHEDAPARYDEYRDRVTAGLNAANLVIAPSGSMLDSLRQNYDAHFDGRVIYNGCHAERFSSHGHPQRSEGPHDVDGSTIPESQRAIRKEPKILAAGRIWDQAKNLRVIDEVAPSISWPIDVAGDVTAPNGSVVPLCHSRALGILSSPQLWSAMSAAAIFAAPARYEPFGLSILEAALSSCALVLGDIGSLRELWNDCALFVDPDDPDDLRDALTQLINDSELRAQLGNRARARAQAFSAARMAGAYRDAYEHIGAQTMNAAA